MPPSQIESATKARNHESEVTKDVSWLRGFAANEYFETTSLIRSPSPALHTKSDASFVRRVSASSLFSRRHVALSYCHLIVASAMSNKFGDRASRVFQELDIIPTLAEHEKRL